MKPVFQYQTGGKWSNCFSACVASLLELPAEAVPDFMYCPDGTLNMQWFEDFAAWLRPYGYAPLMITTSGGQLPLIDCYYLIGGKSIRGIMHSVVGLNGQIVHDPYPAGAGLTEITDFTVLVRTFY